MIDLRPILYVIGILLTTLAASMVVPMLVALHDGNHDWKPFFLSILITLFFGGLLILTNLSKESFTLSIRQAFLLTTASWLSLAIFATLPLWLSELGLSFTDAFFESMSGITTTGATILPDLDIVPRSILIWRAILQWLGGIGIIVVALSILPFLKVGGMQLFRTESSEKETVMPRAAKLASSIAYIYLTLTCLCAASYHIAGMPLFDAVAHAMTTISTGGFSTFNASFSHYDTPHIEIVSTLFMISGALPFILYIKTLQGNKSALPRNAQVRLFLAIIIFAVISLVFYLVINGRLPFDEALRRALFNVISIITGTGYVSADYSTWGSFATILLFFLMVVGGCAGSTSCGIKIFRFQVLYAVMRVQLRKLIHPHGLFTPHYNGYPLPDGVPASVISFFFLFAICFSILALALAYIGLDFITALSAATAALANVGPGMGDIVGPAHTFTALPDAAKWILAAGMLTGRLELFTVLILFFPHFWRQ